MFSWHEEQYGVWLYTTQLIIFDYQLTLLSASVPCDAKVLKGWSAWSIYEDSAPHGVVDIIVQVNSGVGDEKARRTGEVHIGGSMLPLLTHLKGKNA